MNEEYESETKADRDAPSPTDDELAAREPDSAELTESAKRVAAAWNDDSEGDR